MSNARGEALFKGVGFKVGSGRDVRFWLDDWVGVGVGPLCGLFPRLFRLAANKESSISNCFKVRSGCNVWGVMFKRDLQSLEGQLYEELLSFLANMFFCMILRTLGLGSLPFLKSSMLNLSA